MTIGRLPKGIARRSGLKNHGCKAGSPRRSAMLVLVTVWIMFIAVYAGSLAWSFRLSSASFDVVIKRGSVGIAYFNPSRSVPLRLGLAKQSMAIILWFEYEEGRMYGYRLKVLLVPLWAFAVVLVGCTIAARPLLRRHRLGHCITCGYDVRSIRSATCPECGNDTHRK